jgi:HK97 family phage prohead protease
VNKSVIATIKAEGPGSRKISFILSTKTKDRDNSVVNGPWVLDNYKKNPVVMAFHDYKSLPVAKCTSIGVQSGNLVATAQFIDAALSPFAEQVYQMLAQGFLKGCSVGFIPIDPPTRSNDGVLTYSKCELLEFSIVPIPSNPEALMRAKSAGAKQLSPEEIVRCIDKALGNVDAGVSRHVNRELTPAETAALVVRSVFGAGPV